jgi:hypothetical protein
VVALIWAPVCRAAAAILATADHEVAALATLSPPMITVACGDPPTPETPNCILGITCATPAVASRIPATACAIRLPPVISMAAVSQPFISSSRRPA